MGPAKLAEILQEAESALKAGEWEAALAKAKTVAASDPSQPEAYFIQGIATMAQGNLAEALPLLQKTTALQPEHLYAHFNLGLLQTKLQDYPAAKASFDRVLTLEPAHPEARLQLAQVLEQSGDLLGALQAYQELMNLPVIPDGKDYLTLAVEGVGRVTGRVAGGEV